MKEERIKAESHERVRTTFVCPNPECMCENEIPRIKVRNTECGYCGQKVELKKE